MTTRNSVPCLFGLFVATCSVEPTSLYQPVLSAKRVMFDSAHRQVVGNADWIVDAQAPQPQPASPTSESAWSGGISAWGYELYQAGYSITQLPATHTLTFGDGSDSDLAHVSVFVSVEPEASFSGSEAAALAAFARAGGGIFFIADHAGAKRCTTCVESWRVIDSVLTDAKLDAGIHVDGNDVAEHGLSGRPATNPEADAIVNGPFGRADTLAYYAGSTVSIDGSNPDASEIIGSAEGSLMVVARLVDGGRVVLIGDSSTADDGHCSSCSAHLHDGWHEGSNRAFLLNATAWLAANGA